MVQVPLALLYSHESALHQPATHNCDHSDKDPIVNPGGRLPSHSDTFANTAALPISRSLFNNLHKLDNSYGGPQPLSSLELHP